MPGNRKLAGLEGVEVVGYFKPERIFEKLEMLLSLKYKKDIGITATRIDGDERAARMAKDQGENDPRVNA